jgi:hypothetical protein
MTLKPEHFEKQIINTLVVSTYGAREVQLNRSCEKLRSITRIQEGEEQPTFNERRKAKLDWSLLA